jgi:TatD DNase family protein
MKAFDTATLSDTHCHLAFAEFDQDREEALKRARQVGVRRILVPGIDVETSRAAVEFAETHKDVYAAVGIHPHHADQWGPKAQAAMLDFAGSNKVVAIGEIGLDYYRNYTPAESQREAFSKQIELAGELQLPIVIHNRDAMHDILPLLRSYSGKIGGIIKGRRGVLHAFSAEIEDAKAAIQAGFYIGIAGPLTYKNSERLRTLAAQVPMERILLETDSPYLAPHPFRGKRNEPAFMTRVAEAYANVKSMEEQEIARKTTDNAGTLFRWNHENRNHHL